MTVVFSNLPKIGIGVAKNKYTNPILTPASKKQLWL